MLLPFCADQSLPPDLIFFVFEPDFCLSANDEVARKEMQLAVKQEGLLAVHSFDELKERLSGAVHDELIAQEKKFMERKKLHRDDEEVLWPFEGDHGQHQAGTSSSSSGTGRRATLAEEIGQRPKRMAKPPKRRSYSGDREIEAPPQPLKPSTIDASEGSQELLDTLAMANTAAREGHGDFIWFSWDSAVW